MKTGFASSCALIILAVARVAAAAESEPAAPAAGAAPAEPAATAPATTSSDVPSERSAATPDEDKPGEEKGGQEVADEDYGHAMQFGLRAGLVGGYRMVFRYDKSPFCRSPDPEKSDKDEQKFCGHGAPLAIDVALSFAPLSFAEPYVWARFGLEGEPETNTESVMAFGAGARIYTMSDSKFKIFVEPAVGVEVEGGAGNAAWTFEDGRKPDYKTDFLFHLAVGGQYDFARAVGVYVNAGLTTGVLRYIHTGLEVGGGVQLRVP